MPTGEKIGELYYQITGDNGPFLKTIDQSEKRALSFGNTLKSIGGFVAKGFAVLQGLIAGVGLATLEAGSDAEETGNKFSVVFDGISESANKAAADLRANYGLSSVASKQLLSDTGDLLSGFGFAKEATLAYSTQVQKAAVDIASFTNYAGGAAGASRAITSALLGETEAMKGLGVSIQQGTKEFKSSVKAIMESTGATERQAKAQVILNEIMIQSKNSMGDFARSQEGFANQSRIAQARLEDLSVSVGERFLPIANELVGQFTEIVESLIENERFMQLVTVSAELLSGSIGVLSGILGTVLNILSPAAYALADFSEKQRTAGTVARILGEETEKQNEEFDINRQRVNRLLDRYKALEKEQGAGVDRTKEMANVLEAINEIYPDSIDLTDDQAVSYKELSGKVKSYTDELIRSLEVEEARDKLIEKRSNLKAITEPYEKQIEMIKTLNNRLTEYEGSLISASTFEESYGTPWVEMFDEFEKLQAPEVVKILGKENLDKLFRYSGGGEIGELIETLLGFDQVSEAFKVANTEFDSAKTKLDELAVSPPDNQDYLQQQADNLIDSTEKKQEILVLSQEYHRQMMWNVRDEYIQAQHEELETKKKTEEEKREEIQKTFDMQIEGGKMLVSSFDSFATAMFESRKSGLDKESEEFKKAAEAEFNYNKLKSIIQIGISTREAAMKTYALLGYPWGAVGAGIITGLGAAEAISIAAMKPPKFADGGIVPGNQFRGDEVIARVNSGEMIINQSDQAKLFDMIKGGNSGSKPVIINIYTQDGRLLARQVVDTINSNGEYRIDMRRIAKDL